MNSNLVTTVYRVCVLLLLGFISVQLIMLKSELRQEMAVQLATLKADLSDELKEIDMVISKLDYVESDINSQK